MGPGGPSHIWLCDFPTAWANANEDMKITLLNGIEEARENFNQSI